MAKQIPRFRFPLWRGALWLSLILELAVIGYLIRPRLPLPSRAFLVKVGPEYVLGWRKGEVEVETATYKKVDDALLFAKKELNLEPGRNPFLADDMERIWVRETSSGFVLMWKTVNLQHLNELTFSREYEAKAFEAAFRSGAYSTSPLGHSVNLIPVRR